MKLQELQQLLTYDVTTQGPHLRILEQNIKQNKGISAKARLDVYRDNVSNLHLRVLDNTYPTVAKVLGQSYWHQLLNCDTQLSIYETSTKSLNDYGAFVPELLKTFCETLPELKEYAYISELAKLEWALHQMQFYENDPVFDWERFLALSPEKQSLTQLITSNSLKIFQSNVPVDELWYSHQDDKTDQVFAEAKDGIKCCLYRDGFKPTLQRLSEPEAELLEKLPNSNLAQLQTELGKKSEAQIEQLFSWIKSGWIVDFKEAD